MRELDVLQSPGGEIASERSRRDRVVTRFVCRIPVVYGHTTWSFDPELVTIGEIERLVHNSSQSVVRGEMSAHPASETYVTGDQFMSFDTVFDEDEYWFRRWDGIELVKFGAEVAVSDDEVQEIVDRQREQVTRGVYEAVASQPGTESTNEIQRIVEVESDNDDEEAATEYETIGEQTRTVDSVLVVGSESFPGPE